MISQEYLTPEKCAHHIIIRGLVRVLMVTEVRRILFFLTKKGVVNHGILGNVPKSLTIAKAKKVGLRTWKLSLRVKITINIGGDVVTSGLHIGLKIEQFICGLWDIFLLPDKIFLECLFSPLLVFGDILCLCCQNLNHQQKSFFKNTTISQLYHN